MTKLSAERLARIREMQSGEHIDELFDHIAAVEAERDAYVKILQESVEAFKKIAVNSDTALRYLRAARRLP